MLLQCVDVTKEYCSGDEHQHVLCGVNLAIEQQDFITIMGRSGCGKTTLLNCMSLLIRPTSGHVLFDGNDTVAFSDRKRETIRQSNVGMVFQEPNLISCLSTLDNLILPMRTGSYNEKCQRALRLMDEVGLTDKHSFNVQKLSGGEQQRVAVLRALVNKPPIIICDEPTGALDKQSGNIVLKLLLNIREKYKSALIVVTHDQKIGTLGDRQFVLDDGVLHER